MPRSKPPPFPPHDDASDDAAGTPRRSERTPYSRRETLPVPPMIEGGPVPAAKPTRPNDQNWVETARPPRRALERQPTNSGLGFGIPSPSFGGDTDFDPRQSDPGANPMRRTTSYERDESLSLGLDDGGSADSEALDLVGRQSSDDLDAAEPSLRADPLAELRERYALGDFSGALTIAEAVLEDDPSNADAQRYAESCRDVLKQMYAARLGALTQVPTVAIPAEQLRWLTLDHRSGFLLSHVDGVSSLEEILDISGMPHLEAMRIIYDLVQQKVISLS